MTQVHFGSTVLAVMETVNLTYLVITVGAHNNVITRVDVDETIVTTRYLDTSVQILAADVGYGLVR